ncbi:MAG: hypothetical protein WCC36_18035, partial [Gammaproteobacteria bacterium]
ALHQAGASGRRRPQHSRQTIERPALDEPVLEYPREPLWRVMEEIDRAMEGWRRLHARCWPED